MSSSGSLSSSVKRACDACHRRKVKCINDGSKSCKNCAQAGLKCTYNAVPQKKGPKGSRAKVISELRETQRQHEATKTSFTFSSPPSSPLFLSAHNSLPPELIETCVDFFFHHVYPTQPILDRERVRQSVSSMHDSPEDYCFVSALCAYMLIQPNIVLPANVAREASIAGKANDALGMSLLADSLQVRKTCNHFDNPTLNCVTTSFFFFGCYFCLEKHNTAWCHLREATTLAVLTGMHQEDTYQQMDMTESMLRRRLFWLLFVTERAYALQTQKPLTLHDTISLPTITIESTDTLELTGFNHLITLFRPFDDTFIGLWNQSLQGCNIEWIQVLQKQLSDALPRYLNSTETQAVDLRTSQQWLRIMIWQLSISQRLLSSSAMDESMTFKFPVELSRDFVVESSRFSQQAMEVHGIGLVKKFFDVACTLIDVMTCVPIDPQAFEIGPRDYLNHLIHTIAKLRGGRSRYLPLLLAKTNDVLPRLGNTLMQSPPPLDRYFEEGSGSERSIKMSESASEDMYEGHSGISPGNSDFAELMGTPAYTTLDSSVSAASFASPSSNMLSG